MSFGSELRCSGCGSTMINFDPKTRTLTCDQCGNVETYSRATLNKNGKVIYCKENALSRFAEGKFDEARRFALDIMNISIDHIPAMFICAFYDDVVQKEHGEIGRFFDKIKNEALDFDEVRAMMTLFKAAVPFMIDYEARMLEVLKDNMQSEEDSKELCDFVDLVCPYFISKRSSASFLTDELAGIYKELAGRCSIPKTCYALLKAVEVNKDSPYALGSFDMHARVRSFYDKFVLPVGEIVKSMASDQWKNKFLEAYNKRLQDYKVKAQF